MATRLKAKRSADGDVTEEESELAVAVRVWKDCE
jgi:hypothetical protein